MNIHCVNHEKALVRRKHTFLGAIKLSALTGVMLLSGCSAFSIGEPEFNCSSAAGVGCTPTREVYAMTHGGEAPEKAEAGSTKRSKSGRFAGSTQEALQEQERAEQARQDKEEREAYERRLARKDPIVDNYVSPQLPDKPVPIRTPAQVMRIWVAPWEDVNGDLITTGFVYTEIEPRRWVITKTEGKGQVMLRPLQQVQPKSTTNQAR